jgi:hypothetical protein
MLTIHVKGRLGRDIVTREHGRRLYAMIREAIDKGEDRVTVDFDGLQVTSVSFFDEAFGQVAREISQERFASLIRLKDIDPFDNALVNDIVISRSRQHAKGNRAKLKKLERRADRGAA